MNDGTDTPEADQPIGELALDAVARHGRRARERGFRDGTPRILRLDRQYWCDELGFRIEASTPDPDAEALWVLKEAAHQIDPSGAPESSLAVALAVLQSTDAERRTWIVEADPAAGAPASPGGRAGVRPRPCQEPGLSETGAAGPSPEADAPRVSTDSEADTPPGSTTAREAASAGRFPVGQRRADWTENWLPGPVVCRNAVPAADLAAQARAVISGEFIAKVIDSDLKHHEVANIPTVASGFKHLEPVASFCEADTRTVLVELRTAIAMVEWSGATSRVWVAAGDARSLRAALWRLRRRLGDVLRASADNGGGGLPADI
jgi:hypothetical protein